MLAASAVLAALFLTGLLLFRRGRRRASPPAGTDSEVEQSIQELVDGSGTSFFWAMRLLAAPQRRAMFTIYAFCRIVDDIADEEGTPEEKRDGLAAWREDIERIYQGHPTFPIASALVKEVAAFGLRKDDLLAVVDGMEMDAEEAMRAPSMADLDLYCDRVASAVGRLSCRVFGLPEAEGDRLAHFLGRALQLTNILRDLAEDAERGRLYLPRELLEQHGMTDLTPSAVLAHPKLPDVCAELGRVAEQHYRDAEAILDGCDRKKRRPAAIMKAVYHRLLDRMVQDGWRNPSASVRLSKAEKVFIALRQVLA